MISQDILRRTNYTYIKSCIKRHKKRHNWTAMAVSDRLTSIKADVIITYGSKSWIKQQNNPKKLLSLNLTLNGSFHILFIFLSHNAHIFLLYY